MTPKSSTFEWIKFAEHDYLAVKTLLAVQRIPYEIVAYHCQQTVEKYLKDLLVQNDLTVPFIHDLLKLNREAQSVLPELKALEKTCELLTPFGTATRYPGGSMLVGPVHMKSIMDWVNSIRRVVRIHFELDEDIK